MPVIRIPREKKIEVIKAVYDISKPFGMGIIRYTPEPLTDTEAELLINGYDGSVSMNYVRGRQCTFHMEDEGEFLTISEHWYDHTREDLQELLNRIGVEHTFSK